MTAALVPGAVALAGCKDDPAAWGTPGAVNGTSSKSRGPGRGDADGRPRGRRGAQYGGDPGDSIVPRFATLSRKFPALRAQLAAGAKYHVSHLAKLKETQGVAAKAAKAPAVPTSSAAALAALAQQEKLAATAHAAAAAKLSGAPARLLAMIAAAETQLGSTLAPKKKAAS